MKYVSYSLWGTNELYTKGAIENSVQLKQFYPDWLGIFYYDNSVPKETIDQIEKNGSIVINKDGVKHGPFWRFLAADIEDCEYVIFRDCDSRLSQREVDAVNEWMTSKKSLHVMRDHPAHRIPFGNNSIGILAGMWGIKGNVIPFAGQIEKFCADKEFKYGLDQTFLKTIYQIFQEDMIEHDDFFSGKPFPTPRTDYRFIGERINPDGTPTTEDWRALQQFYKL